MSSRPLLLVACCLAACRPGPLAGAGSSLRFELLESPAVPTATPELVFQAAWAEGSAVTRSVRLVNVGARSLEVQFSGLSGPFSADLPTRVEPGATVLAIHFRPVDAGVARARLVASSPDVEPAHLDLAGPGVAAPRCVPRDDCHRARFDVDAGACAEAQVEDGARCDPHTRCLDAPHCELGRCVGEAVRCDDGNACTVDVCHAQTGCEFLPAPPCPGDGICQVGTCVPDAGCGLVPAEEGTRCGPLQSCTKAQVCLSGRCELATPPDGHVCEEASPCSDQGRCQHEVCVHQQAAPLRLEPRWAYDSLQPADGGPTAEYHDFVLEPSGAMTLGGFFSSPGLLRANTAAPLLAATGARRCILWNQRLVCADYPRFPNGKVSSVDLATGAILWTFDLREARPDFMAVSTELFMARLVVQSADRLAALFESYPKQAPDAGTEFCRAYFLVILDARGQLVSAQPLVDPLLAVCNHPHPYGAVADSVGNLTLAFSPTITAQAPLLPADPTLLFSFTRDGLTRWKSLVPGMTGGELAVARGLLYPENSPVVLSAATGDPVFTLERTAGRIVVADARHIPAPDAGGTELRAYEAGGPRVVWTHTLPPGFHFHGDQLRLATWATSTGPRTVALTFLEGAGGTTRLHAVDVQNGLTGFSCEATLPPRTEPQLFEVADGHLAVMGGALDRDGGTACERCDPPMANSSAAFESFDLPGVTRATEPWPGTFGGPSHDHQEKRTGR